MDSSSINLSPPPLSPPPPHPGVSIARVSPFPPLLDLGESSAQRPCKHMNDGFPRGGGCVGDRRRPRFQCYSPDLIPYPSPSSNSPKPPPRQKPPDTPCSPAGNASTPPCTECGKHFSSWKALFGHMRCHPERQWRGINPPPHLRRPPQLLLTGPSPPAPDDSEEDEYEVASCLLLLSRGRPRTETCEARGGGRTYEAGSSSVPPPLMAATSGGKNARGWKRSWEKRAPAVKHRKRWKWAEDGGGGKPNGSKRKLLDLNLPPPAPMDGNEGCSSGAILDLRLGI